MFCTIIFFYTSHKDLQCFPLWCPQTITTGKAKNPMKFAQIIMLNFILSLSKQMSPVILAVQLIVYRAAVTSSIGLWAAFLKPRVWDNVAILFLWSQM